MVVNLTKEKNYEKEGTDFHGNGTHAVDRMW